MSHYTKLTDVRDLLDGMKREIKVGPQGEGEDWINSFEGGGALMRCEMQIEFGLEFENKLYTAVYQALEQVGLDVVKAGPFFGLGESGSARIEEKAA